MKKVLMVTGSRAWDRNKEADYNQITRGLIIEIKNLVDDGATEIEVWHGGAKGADQMTEEFINKIERSLKERLGVIIKTKVFLPEINKYGSPSAFHIRNQAMVDGKPDVLAAFPRAGEANKGTLSTMSKARDAGVKVEVYGARELDVRRT
jgi:hypothetical protein